MRESDAHDCPRAWSVFGIWPDFRTDGYFSRIDGRDYLSDSSCDHLYDLMSPNPNGGQVSGVFRDNCNCLIAGQPRSLRDSLFQRLRDYLFSVST
jgi:hypothetical protein